MTPAATTATPGSRMRTLLPVFPLRASESAWPGQPLGVSRGGRGYAIDVMPVASASPARTFGAYVLLSLAWWTTASVSIDSYWSDIGHVLAFGLWLAGAAAFLRRKKWGWLLLVLTDSAALVRWVEEPNEWLLFTLQIAAVSLLLAPPIVEHAALAQPVPRWLGRRTTPRHDRLARATRPVVVAVPALATAWLATHGDAAAIALAALTILLVLLPARLEAVFPLKAE